jgi:hypothetical protein
MGCSTSRRPAQRGHRAPTRCDSTCAPSRVLVKFHEWWAANHGSDRVYATVRGDGERWHTILPWSMLAPMRQTKGYDDRLILDGITRVLDGCREYFKYGERLKRKVLSRDAPIEESYLDRIPRDELQRMGLS